MGGGAVVSLNARGRFQPVAGTRRGRGGGGAATMASASRADDDDEEEELDGTPAAAADSSSDGRHRRRHSRRGALAACAATAMAACSAATTTPVATAQLMTDVETLTRLQQEAADAYAAQDFDGAFDALSRLRKADPDNPNWIEGRAQVGVDAKKFKEAISDYTALLGMIDPESDGGAAARFRAGRALAYEGLYAWPLALDDYDETLRLAAVGGFFPDPYILNARGNVKASLGDWAGAREDYSESARLFQGSKGFRSGASTTQRLDGAVYAASNAALALAQLGDDAGAVKEAEAVMRRAPNSADMRAALAALYYSSVRRLRSARRPDPGGLKAPRLLSN